MILRALLLALSTRPRIGEWMNRLPVTRGFVRRFVAGTAADDALAVIADLNARGLQGAVTYLGENVRTPAEAEHATEVYVQLLDEIKRRNLLALPSLKLTHLGLDLGEPVGRANLTRVLERGRATGTRVWIDMESSAYTERTLALYARLRPTYANCACVPTSSDWSSWAPPSDSARAPIASRARSRTPTNATSIRPMRD